MRGIASNLDGGKSPIRGINGNSLDCETASTDLRILTTTIMTGPAAYKTSLTSV